MVIPVCQHYYTDVKDAYNDQFKAMLRKFALSTLKFALICVSLTIWPIAAHHLSRIRTRTPYRRGLCRCATFTSTRRLGLGNRRAGPKPPTGRVLIGLAELFTTSARGAPTMLGSLRPSGFTAPAGFTTSARGAPTPTIRL